MMLSGIYVTSVIGTPRSGLPCVDDQYLGDHLCND